MATIQITKHGGIIVNGRALRIQSSLGVYGEGADYHPDGDYFMGCEDVAKLSLGTYRLIENRDLEFLLEYVSGKRHKVAVHRVGTEWFVHLNNIKLTGGFPRESEAHDFASRLIKGMGAA